MKSKLFKEQNALIKHRQFWECKLNELNVELNTASDKIYHIKSQARRTIQGQIDKTASNKADMQNYIGELQQSNYALNEELQWALNKKWDAVILTKNARSTTASQLKKWHDERNMKRSLQDEVVA